MKPLFCARCHRSATWLDLTAERLLCDHCAPTAADSGHLVRHTATGAPYPRKDF